MQPVKKMLPVGSQIENAVFLNKSNQVRAHVGIYVVSDKDGCLITN